MDEDYGLPAGSGSMETGRGGGLLTMAASTDPFPGDKYISRRSSKKEKEKFKKRKSGTSKSLSSSPVTALGMSGSTRTSSVHSSTSNNSNRSSPNTSNEFSLEQYGNKYVLPPKQPPQVEHEALLDMPSLSMDRNDPLAATAGADGECWKDEFEDEMDEIEMRNDKRRNFDAFGDTQISPFRKRIRSCRTYIIPILLGILFLLGLVAIVMYLIQRSNNNSNKKIVQVVRPAPESLDLICAAATKVGTNMFEIPVLCQEVCQRAECCWNPEGDYVCTTDTQSLCPAYEAQCGNWEEHIKAQKAQEAQEHSQNPPMVVPPLPPGLQTACERTDFVVSDDCRTQCHLADCCWYQHATSVCTTESKQYCPSYQDVCTFLNDPLFATNATTSTSSSATTTSIPFPPAPSGLDIYCDPGEMEAVSLHICTDKCGQAECCWKAGVTSCVDKYPPQACHAYTQACGILNDLKTAPGASHDVTSEESPDGTESSNANNVPEAPSDLADTCSKERIADDETGAESLIVCEQICTQASCCWQPNAATPCTQNARCNAYHDPCQIFVSLYDKPKEYDPTADTLPPMIITDVPAPPQSISMNCDPDVLNVHIDNGKFIVECERECLMGACCWKHNHPTQCPDASQCSAYMIPCGKNLVTALEYLETGGAPPKQTGDQTSASPAPTPSPPVVETNVPAAPSDLNMMCHKDVLTLDVSSGAFIMQCEKECLDAACCWKEGHATICPDAPECADYMEPCKEHLVPVLAAMENSDQGTSSSTSSPTPASTSSIAKVPTDMVLRCSVENLSYNPNGRALCEKICNAAECCWNSDVSSCSSDSNCLGYQICGNLKTTPPMNTGSSTTTPTTTTGSSNNSGNSAPPAPPSNLAKMCAASEIISMLGLETCKVACEAAACCFLDSGSSQSCSSSSLCATYKNECALMREELGLASGSGSSSSSSAGSSSSGATTLQDVQRLCDDSTQFYLRSACVRVCQPGECCQSSNCPSTTDCSIYEPCSVLNNRRLLRH